jgi:methionyl-tRNA formyltransferase
MNRPTRIVIATPHARHDDLQRALAAHDDVEVYRLRSRDELTIDGLRTISPELVFFPHWSWRIPRGIHEAFECVVFHMTDVPYGRGGSPLQNLIMAGQEQTKLSALRCVEEMDAGPVYLKCNLSTLGTAEEVLARAARLMESMILELVRHRPQPTLQVGEVVHFNRRRPEQGDIGHAGSLAEAHDMIRMLDADGYPNAFVEVGGLRLEFTRASLRADHIQADVRITWLAQAHERS